MFRKLLVFACMALILAVAARPTLCGTNAKEGAGPSDDARMRALSAGAGAGTMQAHTHDYLEELSDDIGARVTGSPEAARAIAWGAEKMKEIGLENVHTESWKLFRGWGGISGGGDSVF